MRYLRTYENHLDKEKNILSVYRQIYNDIFDKAKQHNYKTYDWVYFQVNEYIIDINYAPFSDDKKFPLGVFAEWIKDKYPDIYVRYVFNDADVENSYITINIPIEEELIESEELGLL